MTVETRGQVEGEAGQPSSEDGRARTGAEWLTLGVSVAIVLSLAALLIYDAVAGGDLPVTIDVRPELDQVRREGDRYYLPVTVVNTGDAPATDVTVLVTLEVPAAAPEETDFTVDFLDGGEAAGAVVIFQRDPSEGRVEIGPISYVEP